MRSYGWIHGLVLLLQIGPAAFAQAPGTAFTADKTTGKACVAVQFTDQSTPGGVPITAWLWDFGDGTTTDPLRTFQNPRHVFETPGTYTVTNASGSNALTKTDYIVVSVVPIFRVTLKAPP